jgi:predicted ATPase
MLYEPTKHAHHAFVYGQDPLAYGYSYGAFNLWFTGHPEQALQSAEQAMALANRAQHPLTVAGVLSFTADLHYLIGDLDAFEELADRAITVAEDQGLPMWTAAGLALKGTAVFRRGNHAAGIDQIRDGVERFLRTGARLNGAYIRSRLVEALLADGQLDVGLKEVDVALGVAQTSLDRYYLPELYRLKASLLERRGTGDAELYYERALAAARRQGAKSLELRAALGAARLHQSRSDEGLHFQRLADVDAQFIEGRDHTDLVAARTFLEAGGG